jgi:histidine triad (HIT) family protein
MSRYNPRTEDNRCVFCDIIAKNDQDVIFWQDEQHVAFLSIDPNTPGFSLVVPKEHHGSDILKMPDADLQAFILAAKKVAAILESFYEDVGRVGLIMEGTGIDHSHIKLVPMHGTDHMKQGGWKQYLSDVEHWFDNYEGWISSAGGPMADRDKLVELSKKIKKSQNSDSDV